MSVHSRRIRKQEGPEAYQMNISIENVIKLLSYFVHKTYIRETCSATFLSTAVKTGHLDESLTTSFHLTRLKSVSVDGTYGTP
jgi:hypothetical protein